MKRYIFKEKKLIDIIRETPILFLDESTSNLDKEISNNIEKSILDLKSVTSIVITHKLSQGIHSNR